MIPVRKEPEPADFHENVRLKGEAFLAKVPAPKSNQWKHKAFWTYCLPDLYRIYKGVCAYSAVWMAPGVKTVDHFKSKNAHPEKAYEWDNFRLASSDMNRNKGTCPDILDPFEIQEGWFTLDFPSLLVKPGKNLPVSLVKAIQTTINRLQLNKEDNLMHRQDWLENYLQGAYGLEYLREKAPFIHLELKRQEVEDPQLEIWKAFRNQLVKDV